MAANISGVLTAGYTHIVLADSGGCVLATTTAWETRFAQVSRRGTDAAQAKAFRAGHAMSALQLVRAALLSPLLAARYARHRIGIAHRVRIADIDHLIVPIASDVDRGARAPRYAGRDAPAIDADVGATAAALSVVDRRSAARRGGGR